MSDTTMTPTDDSPTPSVEEFSSPILPTLGQEGEVKTSLKNKNAPSSNEHIIYQDPQHNVLGIEIQNGQDQTITFASGGAPTDLPAAQNGDAGSGLYFNFGEMDPTSLKTFEPGDDQWRTRVVEKTGLLEKKEHWLIIDRPKGDSVDVAPDDTLWIPLNFPGAPDTSRQSGDVSEQYRLKKAGTNAGTSEYTVCAFGEKPPEPLSVGIDGKDQVQILIEGEQQQVPPSTLVVRLRNSSDVPLVQSKSGEQTEFIVSPSTAPADSTPASDVLTSPKFGAGVTAQAENSVAQNHWTIDTNKDEKYIHLKPQKEEVLGPNEQALFRLDNIKTTFGPGPSNLYVSVRSLPGYRDTTRVVTVDKIRARPTVQHFDATATEKKGNETKYTLEWETYGYETQTYLKVPSLGINEKKPHKGSQEITLHQPYASVTLECRNADGSKPTGHAHWKKTLTLEGSPAKKGLGQVIYPVFGSIYGHNFETENTEKFDDGGEVEKTMAMTKSPNHIFWQNRVGPGDEIKYSDPNGTNCDTLKRSKRFRALSTAYSGKDCVYYSREVAGKGQGVCISKECSKSDDSKNLPVKTNTDKDTRPPVYILSSPSGLSGNTKYFPIIFSSLNHLAGAIIVEDGCKCKSFSPVQMKNLCCLATGATFVSEQKGERWTILVYTISKKINYESSYYLRSVKIYLKSRGHGRIKSVNKIKKIGDYAQTEYAGLDVEPQTKDPIWVEPGSCEEEPLADLSSANQQLYRIRRYIRSRDTVADLLQISRPQKPKVTDRSPEQGLVVFPRANGSEERI